MLNARIKLRHLQAFLEVARQRSFARAAERLSITQPGFLKLFGSWKIPSLSHYSSARQKVFPLPRPD